MPVEGLLPAEQCSAIRKIQPATRSNGIQNIRFQNETD